jgi:hypothetical protein
MKNTTTEFSHDILNAGRRKFNKKGLLIFDFSPIQHDIPCLKYAKIRNIKLARNE